MHLGFNIFTIKVSDFNQVQEDPFGFENISKNIGDSYLPFAAANNKASYFFFITYVNWLTSQWNLNPKQKIEVRLRLEKLLVLSWKKGSDNLTSKGVLGNRQTKTNPFRGSDGNWIVQTCFKIYGASTEKLIPKDDNTFLNKYRQDNPQEEKLLKDFINRQGLLDKRNEIYLNNLLNKFGKKSLFSGKIDLLPVYKNIFKKYLQKAIQKTNSEYYNDIQLFFSPSNNLPTRLYKKTIENETKYPFKAMNNWFSAFILAVDKDINNENSKNQWIKADKLFLKIADKYKKNTNNRPEPKCWFIRVGDKYIPQKDNDFRQEGWNALLKRANSSNFYDFKHTALKNLLLDIY